MIRGDDFIIKEKPEKKYTDCKEKPDKDFFAVIIVVVLWIFWVILYMVFLKPFVSSFFFDFLKANSYPGMINFLLMFVIPVVGLLLLHNIYKLSRKFITWIK